MTLIDDYLEESIKYAKKYGEHSIVLMQVGHFYEAYAVDNDNERVNADNMYRLSDIMNIQLTRKNKSIAENSRGNPLMIGVNIYSIDKYIQILLNSFYTIILIEQTSQPPFVKREVTNIYSPGTNIKYTSSGDSNNLVAIYVEEIESKKNYNTQFCCGASCIDLSTGKNMVYETYSKTDDSSFALDELFKFIQVYEPKEVILVKKNVSISDSQLFSYLYLSEKIVHVKDATECDKEFFQLNYQSQFLGRIFKNTGLLTPIEFIGLESLPFALNSYIFLLQFAYEHSESIIKNIEQPTIWELETHLSLTNNTINQLNLVANPSLNCKSKFNSLFAVINNTSTAIGRRYLKDNLLNPIVDCDKLNDRYDCVDAFLSRISFGADAISGLGSGSGSDSGLGLGSGLGVDYAADNECVFKIVEKCLNKIIDLERVHRKMSLEMLQPTDLSGMIYSYESVLNIIHFLTSLNDLQSINSTQSSLNGTQSNNVFYKALNKLIPNTDVIGEFKTLIHDIYNDFNLDECVKYHADKITGNIFNPGIFEEIDAVCKVIEDCRTKIGQVNKFFSNILEKGNNSLLKFENNERDGYYLTSTAKRVDTIKKSIKGKSKLKIGELELDNNFEFKTQNKSLVKISSPFIRQQSNCLIASFEKLKHISRTRFLATLSKYYAKYSSVLGLIAKFVGNIDVIKSVAKTSSLYGYIRPSIWTDSSSLNNHGELSINDSFLCAKQIRHPIIERLGSDIEYVSNDIALGLEISEDEFNGLFSSDSEQQSYQSDFDNKEHLHNAKGILLFGTNASGKSSLMKAVGLNIILAQSGHFVACNNMIYKPYTNIFTRINNNDNIFKGESSFAVEMSELRSILKRANRNSLVLGDELCAGTESISALSIFSSSVVKMKERGTSFIFATHLHELCNIPKITALETIKMFHLKVIYEQNSGVLVYDRKLEYGNGPAMYGLEVCKAMNMDTDFLLLAEEIRKDLLGVKQNVLDKKQSRYNSKLYIHTCEICKQDAEDVHHIKFQCTSDVNNMIDGAIQKDVKSNLVPLCKSCHNKVHNSGISIFGYKQTSEGVVLDYIDLQQQYDNELSSSISNPIETSSLEKDSMTGPITDSITDSITETSATETKVLVSNLGTTLEVKTKKKKKYDESQISNIRMVAQTHKTSKKAQCLHLENKFNIKISVTTLNKILKGDY